MPQKKGSYRPAVLAKKGEVPNGLVGRKYSTFTAAQWDSVTEYRNTHKLCHKCGSSEHLKATCPKVPKPQPTQMRQHAAGTVPIHLENVSYKAMTQEQRKEMSDYRRMYKLCTDCGVKGHHFYVCPRREVRIQKAKERKVAAIASGKLKLLFDLTGPFAKMPAEVKGKIFEFALSHDDPQANSIEVWPRYLPALVRVPGLTNDALAAWLRINKFVLWKGSSRIAFNNLLTNHNVENNVRTLALPGFSRSKKYYKEGKINNDIQLAMACTGLHFLRLNFRGQDIGVWKPWMGGTPGLGSWDVDTVTAETIKTFSFDKLLDHPTLKTLHLVAVQQGDPFHGIENLAAWFDKQYKEMGKEVEVVHKTLTTGPIRY